MKNLNPSGWSTATKSIIGLGLVLVIVSVLVVIPLAVTPDSNPDSTDTTTTTATDSTVYYTKNVSFNYWDTFEVNINPYNMLWQGYTLHGATFEINNDTSIYVGIGQSKLINLTTDYIYINNVILDLSFEYNGVNYSLNGLVDPQYNAWIRDLNISFEINHINIFFTEQFNTTSNQWEYTAISTVSYGGYFYNGSEDFFKLFSSFWDPPRALIEFLPQSGVIDGYNTLILIAICSTSVILLRKRVQR